MMQVHCVDQAVSPTGSTTNKQSQDNSQSQSGSGSGDNCNHTRKSESTGNGSGSGSGDTGRTSSVGRSYRHVQLTEEVLSKHNADMQKMFMQRQRTGLKPHKDKAKLKTMKKALKRPVERVGHGALLLAVSGSSGFLHIVLSVGSINDSVYFILILHNDCSLLSSIK